MADDSFPPRKEAISSKSIVETKRLSVFEDSVTLPNGSVTQRLRIAHPGAVVVLAYTAEEEVVFVRQYRRSISRDLLELPAGTLDPNEDPLTCAKRELEEETGLQAERWTSLGQLYPAPGFCDELQFLYWAEGLVAGAASPEPTEQIVVEILPITEVRNRVKSLEIIDAKSLSCLYRAELLGLLAK